MLYCGLDVAVKSSYLYIVDARGRKVASGEVETSPVALIRRLRPYIRRKLAVALEAGSQSAWIHDLLVELGARVTVVPPAKLRLIAESRRKTDKIDARLLAELLRVDGLPEPVHVPDRGTRSLRQLLVARQQLVRMRTALINTLRGLLRQEGVNLPAGELTSLAGWRRLRDDPALDECQKMIVETLFEVFEVLMRLVRRYDQQLDEWARRDPRVARLRTIPKVGRIASLTLMAAVGDVGRFGSSRKLIGYSGLAPSVRSSGERTIYGRITRQGRSELRAVWVQIAHLVAADTSRETEPLRRWFVRLARRRGRKTAIVALARKLLTIAFRLLSDETVYDPARVGVRAV